MFNTDLPSVSHVEKQFYLELNSEERQSTNDKGRTLSDVLLARIFDGQEFSERSMVFIINFEH